MTRSIRTPLTRPPVKACVSAALFAATALVSACPLRGQAPSTPQTTWSITVVLPPRIVAGRPATLAALGVDGRLASGVKVDVGDQEVTTDRAGRALFNAPASAGYMLATASGASFATLVDPPGGDPTAALTVAPAISLHDQFSICGGGLSGDAEGNLVKISGVLSLVLAASPECIVVLPGPKVTAGPATITVATETAQFTAKTSIVSLSFEAPNPGLLPGKRGDLLVRVAGSDRRLRLVVENQTPGVLRFLHGDSQQVVTSGGTQNEAAIRVEAVTSGKFSFHARVIGGPDPAVARRYLQAAQLLAPRDEQRSIQKLINQLDRHPQQSARVAVALNQIRVATIAGDLRTLLDAAQSAL